MGLYSKARRIIDERDSESGLLNRNRAEVSFPPETAIDSQTIEKLTGTISEMLLPHSSACLIAIDLGPVVSVILRSPNITGQVSIITVSSFVSTALSKICRIATLSDRRLILVIPGSGCIDSDLILHQLLISLSLKYNGLLENESPGLNARSKVIAADPADIRGFLEELV